MPPSLPIFPSSLGTQMKKPESIFLLDAFATEKSNVLRTKPCRKDAAGKEEPPESSFPCTAQVSPQSFLPAWLTAQRAPAKNLKG